MALAHGSDTSVRKVESGPTIPRQARPAWPSSKLHLLLISRGCRLARWAVRFCCAISRRAHRGLPGPGPQDHAAAAADLPGAPRQPAAPNRRGRVRGGGPEMPAISLRTVYQTLNDLSAMGELQHARPRHRLGPVRSQHRATTTTSGVRPLRRGPRRLGRRHQQPRARRRAGRLRHRAAPRSCSAACAGTATGPTRPPHRPYHPHPPSTQGDHAMADLKGTKTHENLKEAFAGESQANRRYLYFAQKADVEGYPDVAALFRSVAEGETGHAFGHFDFLAEVGDPVTGEPVGATEDNLRSAIAGETYEYTEMYPGFAKTARDEGFDEIAEWFETLARAEKSHAGRFTQGLDEHLQASSRDRSRSQPVSRVRPGGPTPSTERSTMTTTYDPHHPSYLDEADLRDELTRVYDLCHGCRLCFKFCTVVPDAVRVHRPPRRPGRGQAHPRRAGPGRRRVLPVQALLRQLPVHPRPARVGDRLPAADAAGRRRCATPPATSTARASSPTNVLGRTDLARQGRHAARAAGQRRSTAKPGSLVRKVIEKTTGIVERAAAAAVRHGSGSRRGSASAPACASTGAPGPRWPCSRRASSSTRTRRSARTW